MNIDELNVKVSWTFLVFDEIFRVNDDLKDGR